MYVTRYEVAFPERASHVVHTSSWSRYISVDGSGSSPAVCCEELRRICVPVVQIDPVHETYADTTVDRAEYTAPTWPHDLL